MNRVFPIIVLTILIATGYGCRSGHDRDADSRPVLAVSIEPQRKILEAVAGPGYRVVSVLPRGANPETFDPTMAQRMDAASATAYFTIGYLPFEKAIAAEVQRRGRVVPSTEGITPIMGTHSHGNHTHNEADPHLWASLRNGQVIAANMAAALCDLDPDGAPGYRRRADSLISVLDSLDAELRSTLPQSAAFGLWHPSLSYFAQDYGLRQLAISADSKEATASKLAQIIKEARADSVRVFFYQQEFDSRQAENISKEIGANLVPINPLEYDWDTQLINIANAIRQSSLPRN